MSKRICVIIIVYNKDIYTYITTHRYFVVKDLDICVVDNSTKSNILRKNCHYCSQMGIQYLPMGGNRGLSAAYNKALRNIKETDYVVFLDDDTAVTEEYFTSLEEGMIENADVYVPYVIGQDGIVYSPNKAGRFKNQLIQIGQRPTNNFNAIMSCLAIKYSLICQVGFDERLFVDQVDQLLFDKLRARNTQFQILDCVIHQNFHQREKLSSRRAWNRLKIRLTDLNKYYLISNYSVGERILGKLKGCYLGLQLTFMSRSIYPFVMATRFELSLKGEQ